MGAKTKLDIETDVLHAAAGKASATLAASAPKPIPPPPPTAVSQLDAALVLVSTSSEALGGKVDTNDITWATRQSERLTAGPPALQQQDVQGAADIQRSAQFPMPGVHPTIGPHDTTKVWTT